MNETIDNNYALKEQVFNKDACTQCGECFNKCPELHLPLDIAKDEINALINNEDGKYVLNFCTTCFSCNMICPNDCKPYQLILENWNRIYKDRGAPPIYTFICPTMNKNIWQMLFALMPKDEISRVERWMESSQNKEPKDDVLLIGNLAHMVSFILGDTKLLDHFTPMDKVDQWECGGYLYQGGYLDVVKKIGEKARDDFDGWKIKKIIPFLDAVEWMLIEVHPNEMGVKFNQEVISFNTWLLEKIRNKEIKLTKKVDMTVTLHDNCFSKAGNGRYWDTPRELIELTGCQLIEMEHIKNESLCCGFGAGASWKRNISIPFDILNGAKKKFKEAEATGAEALISYCGGCLYLLWAAKELFNSKMKVFHSIELMRMAMGEEIDMEQKIHSQRAWDIITIITYHLIRGIFHKPFPIEDISGMPERKKFLFLRFLRKIFNIPGMKWVYRKIFALLLPLLRTKRPKEIRD